MRFKTLIALAAAITAMSACNRNEDTSLATDANVAGPEDVALGNETVTAAPASAQEFVNAAAASDRFEIETSRLAASAGSSPAVRDFAKTMIAAHTASTAKLESTLAAQPAPIVLNDALNPEQQATLADLKGKSGPDFDTAYAAAQVSGHEKTLAALNGYASSGENAALKQFASELVPTVTEHLSMARKLK